MSRTMKTLTATAAGGTACAAPDGTKFRRRDAQ